MARSTVKSRSHHDVAHLHLLTNVPTKYQLSDDKPDSPDKLFPAARPRTHPDTMGDNNTPQPLRAVG